MTKAITLLVSSGGGPVECRQAVAHILRAMSREAQTSGVDIDVASEAAPNGPKSAIVRLHADGARELAGRWLGTIQWICKSQIRKSHKRQNWFVGIFELPDVEQVEKYDIDAVQFETFRAGGPGGQHQNTTDSAVRATCTNTGISVVVREGRSQHRNKAIAVERLQTLLSTRKELNESLSKQKQNHLHHQLERGNPVRRFKGASFREVK